MLPAEIIDLVNIPNSNNETAMFPLPNSGHIPGLRDENIFPNNTSNDDEELGGS